MLNKRTRQITRCRVKAILRRPQTKQYTASNEGSSQTQRERTTIQKVPHENDAEKKQMQKKSLRLSFS